MVNMSVEEHLALVDSHTCIDPSTSLRLLQLASCTSRTSYDLLQLRARYDTAVPTERVHDSNACLRSRISRKFSAVHHNIAVCRI